MTERIAWSEGREYLCLGVAWPNRTSSLHLVDTTGATIKAPLTGRRLGFQVVSPDIHCEGRYGFVDGTGIEHVPCPANSPAAKGRQCEKCATDDEFKFAHHFHNGGYAPPALVTYMNQRHWVYVATFADGTSKVGTASDVRKVSRLDEQAAVLATYVASAVDGRSVRRVEDAVTSYAGLSQFRRRSAKVAAIARPLDNDALQRAHDAVVEGARRVVAGLVGTPQVSAGAERWAPPGEMTRFLELARAAVDLVPYPHELSRGEHGLFVLGCAGPAALVSTSPGSDLPRYVADLGSLKGVRIVPGQYASPPSMVQTSLF